MPMFVLASPWFSSLIVGVGLFGNFFAGCQALLGFDVSQFFVESLILAQDERWRRA